MLVDPTWPARVPKVELHLHLEGAIPLPALWQLMQKYGGDRQAPEFRLLEERFQYRDFQHFLATWIWKNSFIREYEDFTYLAEAFARDLVAQNIRYAEVFYSPPDFAVHGLKTQQLTEAIRMGLSRVPEVRIALIADVVRNYGPRRADRTLSEVAEVRDLGVLGIGLGGDEKGYPPELFAAVFARARELGLHTTAHAGEGAGAASVWGAVRSLQVERIGHGTCAAKDDALVDYLIAHRIPIEMCPISNLQTGVVATIEQHPIRRFFAAGAVVTVNTDDPKMFGNSLAGELTLLAERLGFSQAELQALLLNGIAASFLSAPEKARLHEEFVTDPAWTA
jgi:adenosine deaminase